VWMRFGGAGRLRRPRLRSLGDVWAGSPAKGKDVVLWIGGGGKRDISGSRGRLRGLDEDRGEQSDGFTGFHGGRLIVDSAGSLFSLFSTLQLVESRGEMKSRDISRRIRPPFGPNGR
jgi:hypothetical protein